MNVSREDAKARRFWVDLIAPERENRYSIAGMPPAPLHGSVIREVFFFRKYDRGFTNA